MRSSKSLDLFFCRERRVLFFALIVYNYCYSSITVSALQVQTRNTDSVFSSRSLASPGTTTTVQGTRRKRQRYASFSSSLNAQNNGFRENNLGIPSSPGMDRREVFSSSAKTLFAGLATPFLLDPADPANALLMKFPVDEPNTQPLKNRYHFMRAGNSELEDEGIYSTNPLFLTNRDNAMSDKGYQSLKSAISTLKKTSNVPTVAYHSLAANGMDTGDLIARELRLGRDRLLPEFTYLDQRGVGLWDSNEEEVVRPAVWAMDYLEAGKEGFGGRPPANTDGTPNDNLHDQFTRLRQFLSLQETRTAGETILVIFPDGTGPALLSCMIAGIPYSEVHALEFKPGELRTDITVASVKELYEARKDDPTYLAIIEDGKEKLKELRSMSAKDFSVTFKDSKADEKEAEETRLYSEKQEAAAAERRKEEEERRLAIQEEIRLSKERAREREEQRKKEQLAIMEQKKQKLREQTEAREKKKAEQQAAYIERKQRLAEASKQKAASEPPKQQTASEPSDSSSSGLSMPLIATAAFGAIGAAVASGADDESETKNNNAVPTTKDGSDGAANTVEAAEETPKSQTTLPEAASTINEDDLKKDKPELGAIPSVAIANKTATENLSISRSTEPPKSQTTLPEAASTINEDDLKKDKPELGAIPSVAIANKTATENLSISRSTETPKSQTTLPEADSTINEDDLKKDKPELGAIPSVAISNKTATENLSNSRSTETPNLEDDALKKKEEEFTAKLQAAEQEMKDALIEAADVKKKKQQKLQPTKKKSSLFDNNPPVIVTKAQPKTTNYVYDDDEDDSDWLRVLGEIRDEEDVEEDDDFGMIDYASLMEDDTQF